MTHSYHIRRRSANAGFEEAPATTASWASEQKTGVSRPAEKNLAGRPGDNHSALASCIVVWDTSLADHWWGVAEQAHSTDSDAKVTRRRCGSLSRADGFSPCVASHAP